MINWLMSLKGVHDVQEGMYTDHEDRNYEVYVSFFDQEALIKVMKKVNSLGWMIFEVRISEDAEHYVLCVGYSE